MSQSTNKNRFAQTIVGKSSVKVQNLSSSPITLELPPFPFNIEQYIIDGEIARGGMCITLRGHVENCPEERVAVKMPLSSDVNDLERFRAEIKTLSSLDQANIVHFRDSGEASMTLENGALISKPWLAMDYIDGQNLEQKLKYKNLAWNDVKIMLEQMLNALIYLHAKALCHCDIKPGNIIFDEKRKTWILVDFGIAKSLADSIQRTLTYASQKEGTWDYMSPEQMDGKPLDIRTDICSLGRTAWATLIGSVPRPGTPYPSLYLGNNRIPQDVDTLISRMTSHRPEDRYQTPLEAFNALEKGANKIETDKVVNGRINFFKKIIITASAIVALSALIWFIGNFIFEQKAVGIYEKNKTSPTKATKELDVFKSDHRLWGRKYVDAKIAELKPDAAKELNSMIEEYDSVIKDFSNNNMDDEFRLSRAQLFLKKYDGIFDKKAQYELIQKNMEDVLVSVDVKKAGILADKGQIKDVLDILDVCQSTLKLATSKQRLQESRTNIIDSWRKSKFTQLDESVRFDDPNSISNGERTLEEIEKYGGIFPALIERKQKYDKMLWNYYKNIADDLISKKKFNEAKIQSELYLKSSVLKQYSADAAELEKYTVAVEDDYDWDNTIKATAIPWRESILE